jgi:Tfp pilus assembly protein PilF
MKYGIYFLLSLTFLINVSGCRSHSSLTTNHPPQSNAELMAIAKQNYQKGELDSAERNLRCVLRTDARNNEAHYYLHLIQESKTKQKRDLERLVREGDGLWHPTLPPKEVL